MLDYFGEAAALSRCGSCDRCVRRTVQPRREPTDDQWTVIQKILSCVARMQGRFGAHRVAQVLRGEQDAAVAAVDGDDAAVRLARLKEWRKGEAAARKVPPYCILTNRTLDELARLAPKNMADLSDIHGMGPVLLQRHGPAVLELLDATPSPAPGNVI